MLTHYYIGLMSGTSMDGIDTVLISFENDTPRLIDTASIAIPEHIKTNLILLSHGENIHLKLLGETDKQLGELFANAVLHLLQKARISTKNVTAIGSHGQTIYHSPNGHHPFTLQIGDPNVIAARTSIITVADFRRRDMALNGQGAPLAPAFHAFLFPRQSHDQFVVNLGGIANITYISANHSQPIIGFDTGPANTLLDQWCKKHCEKSFDRNGDWARNGKLQHALLAQLLDDDYFKKPFPKSTGREYFNLSWLLKNIEGFSIVDIQRTLVELTAKTIADAINRVTQTSSAVWICGGGINNLFLMERLQNHCMNSAIKSTAQIGIGPQWIEAAAFAWLAKQTIENKPGNLPSVTGASRASVLGGIFT